MQKQRAALLSVASNTVLIVFKVVAGILMGSISDRVVHHAHCSVCVVK